MGDRLHHALLAGASVLALSAAWAGGTRSAHACTETTAATASTGRTVTCTNPAYASGFYTSVDATNVVVDGTGGAVVIGPGPNNGIASVTNSTSETRGLSVKAIGDATIGTTGAYLYGILARHSGLGGVTVESEADITTTGDNASGIHAVANKADNASAVSVTASSGAITTTGASASAIRGEHRGLGDLTLSSGADLTTSGAGARGIFGVVWNNASHGTLTVETTGGAIDTVSGGIFAGHFGLGDVVMVNRADVLTRGTNAPAVMATIDQTASAGDVSLATTGAVTTLNANAIGVFARNLGTGGLTLSSGSIVSTQGANGHGLHAFAGNGGSDAAVLLEAHGGSVSTAGSQAHGLYAFSHGTGATTVRSAVDVDTQGQGAHGVYVHRRREGDTVVAVSDGAITTSGDGAHGVFLETHRLTGAAIDMLGSVTVDGDISVTGASSSAIMLQLGDTTAAATANDGVVATANVIVGETATLRSSQSAAIAEGTPSAGNQGIIATDLTVRGTVETGVVGGVAIDLQDGDDTVRIGETASITGSVDAGDGVDTLSIEYTAQGAFDVGDIGTQYLDFETYRSVGLVSLVGTAPGMVSAWTVAGGRTAVDGAMAATDFTVDAGAALGGIGTLGDLTAFGEVAPGASIGTLTVAGDARFETGSTFAVEVASDGTSDLLSVAGTTVIATGTTLKVTGIDPLLIKDATRNYTVLTSQGGLTGVFGTVVQDNLADIDLIAIYDATDLRVRLTPTSVVPPSPTVPTVPTVPTGPTNPTSPTDPPSPTSPTGGTQTLTSPKTVFAAAQAALISPAMAFLSVLPRTDQPRGGRDEGSGLSFLGGDAFAGANRKAVVRAVADELAALGWRGGPVTAYGADPGIDGSTGLGSWAPRLVHGGLFGQVERVDSDADGRLGFEVRSAGLQLGFGGAREMGAGTLVFGAATAYSRTAISLDDRATPLAAESQTARSDNAHLALWAGTAHGALSAEGRLAGTLSRLKTERRFASGGQVITTNGETDGWGLAGVLRLSYDVLGADRAVALRPYLQAQGALAALDAFTETGGGVQNLAVEDAVLRRGSAELGVSLALRHDWGGLSVTPSIGAGYRRNLGDRSATSSSSLALLGGRFTQETAALARDMGLISAGLLLQGQGLTLDVGYEGGLGSGTEAHAAQLRFSRRF